MSKTALDARRAPMYHDEMTASAAPTTGSPKERNELAVADTWKLDDIYASAPDVGGGLRRARSRHPGAGRPARHAGLGGGGAPRRAPGSRRPRPAGLSRLLLRRPPLRPGPARQRRQRPPPARPAPAGAVAARRRRGSTPSCSRCRWRRVHGWMEESERARACTASRSRICTGSRSTSSTRRASGCWRCRRSSATPPTTATTRCRPPTRRSRPSRCRPAKR